MTALTSTRRASVSAVSPARRGRSGVRARAGHVLVVMVAAGVVAFGWKLAAPLSIGGRASYVITDGISMLPHMRTGGLAITEREASYHVGEVAAYHNKQLGVVVLHRIIGRNGGRYVFKGDNNDFIDNYHPTQAEIVGARVLYIPRLGHYLMELRQPIVAAVLLGLAGMFAVGGERLSRRRRRRAHHAIR